MRELILSVTLDDCTVQTFRCGGKGGQNVNKRDTGVRIIHPPSGAVGQSCDERRQLQNKKIAFRRMAETPEFKTWVRIHSGDTPQVVASVDRAMWPVNIKTEVRKDGKWVES